MCEPCMCGDTDCPICGTLQGTYSDPSLDRDPDQEYDDMRQREIDDAAQEQTKS